MGNIFSNSREEDLIAHHNLVATAQRNFDFRIRNYSYAYHGSYIDYVHWCRAQYELECIPEFCRQGPNYRPENHTDDY